MMRDLIVLVADKNMEMVVRGLLARPEALGICPLQFDVIVHPRRDPGVRRNAADFLRSCLSSHRYALVMFDREGCGDEGKKVQELQDLVQKQLDQNGWKDRSAVIVLDPELEIWMFVESPQVVDILAEGDPALWNSVITKYGGGSGRKPKRPKEAVEKVLWGKADSPFLGPVSAVGRTSLFRAMPRPGLSKVPDGSATMVWQV